MRRQEWSAGAVAAVAALALAAGGGTAFAQGPDFDDNGVPAGKVEHAVWTMDVTGTYRVPGALPAHQREERWVAGDRGRSVVTDAASGKVASEMFQDPSGLKMYNGQLNAVFSAPAQPFLAIWSSKTAAGFEQGMLDRGRLVRRGLTTFAGQTVLRLESPGEVSGDAPGDKVRSFDLVDPQTLTPIRKITDVTDADGRVLHQVYTRVSSEVVDAASLPAGTLAFGDHPGAEVRASNAKAKAKVNARPKAKHKAKGKGKAHRRAATRR